MSNLPTNKTAVELKGKAMKWSRVSIKTKDTEYWAEQIFGNVLIPVIKKAKIKSYWFSRYNYGEGWREILFSHIPTKNSETVIRALAGAYELKFWEYDCENDIGGVRFCNDISDSNFDTALAFMRACSDVTMMNIHNVNGVWIPGISNQPQNPHNNVAESYHHMFWNITQCPMFVYPSVNAAGAIEIHTYWTKRPLQIEREMEIKVHF